MTALWPKCRRGRAQRASDRVASIGAQYVRTDGGNLIYDAKCGVIHDPARLADDLKLITGVVEHGLFLDLADEAIIGTDTGVETLTP